LCYNFFGKQGRNLHPHCRAARPHRGDKTRQKNSLSAPRKGRTEPVLFFFGIFKLRYAPSYFFSVFFFKIIFFHGNRGVASSFSAGAAGRW
jgi:hypothetical protein